MQQIWCWRCRAEMPMLDEPEWREVMAARESGRATLGALLAGRPREATALGERVVVDDSQYAASIAPMLAAYEWITGYKETNPNAVWHHRASLYGPPCRMCGKPLRTPAAQLCAACGSKRVE